MPTLLRQRGSAFQGNIAQAGYANHLVRLYEGIVVTTGAQLVVDSSKEASDAALLRLIPDVDPYYVHIVRDPRGIVFSSLRADSKAGVSRRFNWLRAAYIAMSWMAGNLAAAAVSRAVGSRATLLRYEDLVAAPTDSLRSLQAFVDPINVTRPNVGADVAFIEPVHSVCGNENRFRTGAVQLRGDEAWRQGLANAERRIVTLVCAPLLKAYGYLGSKSPPPDSLPGRSS